MSKRLIIASILVTGLAAGMSAGYCLRSSQSEGTKNFFAKTAAFRSPAAAAIQSQKVLYTPAKGLRYIYTFSRRITMDGLKQPKMQAAYHGELYFDVTEANADGFTAFVRNNIAEMKKSASSENVALQIHLSAYGDELQIFGKSKDAPTSESNRQEISVIKDLLSLWAFRINEDTVGKYESELSQEGLVITKTKKHYFQIPSRGKTPVATPEIASSVHHILWDPTLAIPREIQGEEKTDLRQQNFDLSAKSEYEISFQKTILLPNIPIASLPHRESLTISISEDLWNDHPDYTSINWPDLQRQLEHADQMASSEQLRLFGDLVKLLRGHPEFLTNALDLLKSQDLIKLGSQSAFFKIMVGALATAASPESQNALIKIYQDSSCPPSGKATILAALTTTQAPLEQPTRDFLANTAKTETDIALSHGAALALGSSLQLADAGSAANNIKQVEQMWAQEAKSGDVPEQRAVLDVIGNSGRSEFLPILESVIDPGTEDAGLRAKAVYALRFIPGTNVAQMIGKSLADTSEQVREAAVEAIRFAKWNEAFRAPLTSCANSETVGRIQSACQAVLAKTSGTNQS